MRYQDEMDAAALKKYTDALNQRAKVRNAPGRISVDLLRSRILEAGGRCEWCNDNLVNQDFEIDHIISLSKQGANTVENLALACPDCNRRKSEKHPASFAQQISVQKGVQTALVRRVLAQFNLDAHTQNSLFHDSDADAGPDPSANADPDAPTPPPYRW